MNPWRRLSSTDIYSTPWFRVRRDQVIQPDGRPGTYSVVSACRVAAGIVPLWPDGSITLVGQYRYPVDEYSWEIPEGGGALDQDPESVARRELMEETGIIAGSWDYLGRLHTSNCFVDEVCHLFLAKDLRQGQPTPEGVEVIQVRRLPLGEAVAMARDGGITDSLTIVAIFRLLAKFDFVVDRARY